MNGKMKDRHEDKKPILKSSNKSFEDVRFETGDSRKQDLGIESEDDMDLEDERINDGAGCCANRCLFLPEWFRVEFNCTFGLAWPMILQQMFQYTMMPISLMFCGRLNTTDFGAAALALTVTNVTGIVLGSGLATACDTLFSQCFGGDNLKRIGILLQRGLVFMIVAIIPIWAFHLNMESFLILVGQERDQAKIAGRYVTIFMPGLLANFEYQVLAKYLQNQNIVLPLIWVGIFGNGVNALFHYIFIFEMDMGTDGSALAQVIGYFAFLLATIIYIYFSGVYKTTWDGWTLEAFGEWGTYAKYALPGMFMLFFDFLAFEVGTFAAGLLSKEELAAQSTILQISAVAYQIPLGTSFACSIRVGQHLGAGDHEAAKRAIWVAMAITGAAALCLTVLFASSGHILPSIFTDDLCVSGLAGMCMPLVAIYELFDAVTAVLSGSLRGCGRQHVGALAIFIGFYGVGSPVALSLMFATPLRTQGFWTGMSAAVFAATVANGVITVFFTNWRREARLARRRAGLKAKAKSQSMLLPDETTDLLDGNQYGRGNRGASNLSIASTVEPIAEFSCPNVIFSRCVCFASVIAILALGLFLRLYFVMPDIYGRDEHQSVPDLPFTGNETSLYPVNGNITNPLCLKFYST